MANPIQPKQAEQLKLRELPEGPNKDSKDAQVTSDDSETWGKYSSKPKSSDHETHLLTVSDCSQRAGQGHSISARPPGQVPRTATHSAPFPMAPKGKHRMGPHPRAGRHLPQCQQNNHHLCARPEGGVVVGRALVIYGIWVHQFTIRVVPGRTSNVTG